MSLLVFPQWYANPLEENKQSLGSSSWDLSSLRTGSNPVPLLLYKHCVLRILHAE